MALSQKADGAYAVVREVAERSLAAGGVSFGSVLGVFRVVCRELEFNKAVQDACASGDEKALVAVDVLQRLLRAFREHRPLDAGEARVVDFFLSEEGTSVLVATTALVARTWRHVAHAYADADENNDGCVCGVRECRRFWARLFCC